MAGQGKTLTALGSYWKGRKPLILAKACVLGSLLPATDNQKRDLAIFEMLMGMDDLSFAARAKRKPKPNEIIARLSLAAHRGLLPRRSSRRVTAIGAGRLVEPMPTRKQEWHGGLILPERERRHIEAPNAARRAHTGSALPKVTGQGKSPTFTTTSGRR